MDAAEKRQRDLDLLRKSRQALDEGELVDRHAPTEAHQAERRQAPQEGDPDVVMYRGKAIRRPGGGGGGGKSSGGGARASQFRGASVGGARSKSSSGGDVRAILEKLNVLYKDGLITKSEYDRKRNQIIDRM